MSDECTPYALRVLTAKVEATNRAHAYANELQAKLHEVLRPLVGSQVVKVDGTLTAKVQKLLPELPCEVPLSAWHVPSVHTLGWTIKAGQAIGDSGWTYQAVTIIIGRLDKGVLATLAAPLELRTNYTVAEVEEKREGVRACKNALNLAKADLSPFAESDY